MEWWRIDGWGNGVMESWSRVPRKHFMGFTANARHRNSANWRKLPQASLSRRRRRARREGEGLSAVNRTEANVVHFIIFLTVTIWTTALKRTGL